VSLVDVAPTLAGLAGLPDGPGWSDGRSLLEPAAGARTVYSTTKAHAPRRFAVTRPPWKYVHFDRASLADSPPKTAQGLWLARNAPPREMLFDLEADPGERRNLAAQHPEVTAELRGMMEAWLAGAGTEGTAPPAGGEDLEKLKALGYVQ
jgi:arylsulfatase A-like enzyme